MGRRAVRRPAQRRPHARRADLLLDTPTTLAVLGAALIHAGWNASLKSRGEPLLESALMHLWLAPVALILLAGLPTPDAFTLACVLASALVHGVYFQVLAAAYRHADFSITYPILRGSAPAMTAVGAIFWMHEHPAAQGWLGIAMICGGVVAMGLLATRMRPSVDSAVQGQAAQDPAVIRKAIAWALCTALTIVAYTLIDSAGVRSAPHAWMYMVWLTLAQALVLGTVVLIRSRQTFVAYARQRGARPMLTGLALVLSYGIALWAMTRAPVAAVAALRETSIVFALLIARLLLGERPGAGRWMAAAVITLGVVVLRTA